MTLRWVPGIGEAREIALLAMLLLCGLLGFEHAYGGWSYLVAGGLGVVFGLLVSYTGIRLRMPVVTTIAVSVAVFFLLGGSVALGASSGPVPGPASLRQLAQAATHGWDQLLTVLPPVGSGGNLLAIPYLLGLTGAVLGHQMLARTRWIWWALLPAAVVLVLSILFGTREPASVLVQGGAFAVLSLAWIAARSAVGDARPDGQLAAWARLVAVLAVAGAGAILLGPRMPMAQAHPRLVLREHIDPPFDPRDYGSPLSAFRKYAISGQPGDRSLGDEVVFTAEGVPAGSLVRIAAMDDFDGVLWNSAGRPGPSSAADISSDPSAGDNGSGYFQRVGDVIPVTRTGDHATIRFSMGQLGGVWMPSVGAATAMRFGGPAEAELSTTFRYNRSAQTAVTGTRPAGQSRGLRPGDSYTENAVVSPADYATPKVPAPVLAAAGPIAATLPDQLNVMDAVKDRASDAIGDASGVYTRAGRLAANLRTGSFSNGEPGQQVSEPGHDAARLTAMVTGDDSLTGDAEQYAALMGVMARQAGLPARVVLGVRAPATMPARWQVKGTDITAWVEVGLDGIGWVALFPTPDQSRQKPEPQPKPEINPRVPDPPKVMTPPQIDVDASSSGQRTDKNRKDEDGGSIPGVVLVAGGVILAPALALSAATGVIVLIKARRRRRRREQGSPAPRIAGGGGAVVAL